MGQLLNAPGPAEYDALLDAWTTLTLQVGVSESYPGQMASTFDELVGLLERAGAITQHGAARVSAKSTGSDRSGGKLELTPVGMVIAVDLLRAQGITVDMLPVPETMDASELAGLAVDSGLDPVAWWELATSWLELQSEEAAAFGDLVVGLNDRGPVSLIIALASMPESMLDRTVSVLRQLALSTDPPPGEIGSAATIFLLRSGQLAEQEVDPDRRMDALLVTLAALAEEGVSIDPELSGDVAGVLDLIAEAGRRLPPRVVGLLDMIGKEHPDKMVAKAARKELFRVRSKLSAL